MTSSRTPQARTTTRRARDARAEPARLSLRARHAARKRPARAGPASARDRAQRRAPDQRPRPPQLAQHGHAGGDRGRSRATVVDRRLDGAVERPDIDDRRGRRRVPIDSARSRRPATEDAERSTTSRDRRPRPISTRSRPSADLVRVYLNEIGKVSLLTAADEVELAKRIEAGLYAAHLLGQSQPLRRHHAGASCGRSWSTASGPRITCCGRTCASWSRWPSATPATACRSWT